MSITVLPWPLNTVFMTHFVYKGHAHQLYNSPHFNCHINKRKTPKTCLTNHKDSISHHITWLVINSLGGRHTHTHTHTHTHYTPNPDISNQFCILDDNVLAGWKEQNY